MGSLYWDDAIDIYKKDFGKSAWHKLHKKPFLKGVAVLLSAANVMAQTKYKKKEPDSYDRGTMERSIGEIKFYQIGGAMELNAETLKAINVEVAESKQTLQNLANDIRITNDAIMPEMSKMVKKIRDTRMTITTELSKSLAIMRDVRKFFLEKDHTDEMKRLEDFVTISERMRSLINDGTMDAVCDVILKLEVGE